ncbi:MAG: DUF4358 domain-containing protein [Ruminococcus sp.]
MKKIISLVCAAAMCVCLFCSCGAKEVNLSEVLDKINSSCNVSGLTKINDVNDLKTYYQIEPEDVKQFAAEIDENSSDAPVEIVMVEAKDSTAAQNVSTKLTNRYNSIYNMYASYSKDQLAVVEKCQVTTDGNFVTLIVSDKAQSMLDVFYSYIK